MKSQEKPCSLMVQGADLRRLQALDPSVMNGYVKIYHQQLLCTIKLLDHGDNELVDRQTLTVSVYERGHKDPDSLKVEITSEIDLFLNLSCVMSYSTYDEMRKSNRLGLNFREYIYSVIRTLEAASNHSQKHSEQVQLTLNSQNGQPSTLRIFSSNMCKQVQLLNLKFYPSPLEKVNQSILFRYNYKKAKLGVIQSSISSIYSVLQKENPSLLEFIKRTVGQVNST